MARTLHCLVEIPKGSRNKYEWDPEIGAIKLDRFLFVVVFPTDYGFIQDTLGRTATRSTRWSACPSRPSPAA